MLEKLNAELKSAMVEKNENKKIILREAISALKLMEKEAHKEITEKEAEPLLESMTKQLEKAIKLYEDGGREDLAQPEREKMEVIKSYLPKKMTEEEVRGEVTEMLKGMDTSNLGKVKGQIIPKFKGRADGGLVGKVIGDLIK